MGTVYVAAFGGTGSKAVNGFSMALAAGIVKEEAKVKVYRYDKDTESINYKDAGDLLQLYQQVGNVTGDNGISIEIGTDNFDDLLDYADVDPQKECIHNQIMTNPNKWIEDQWMLDINFSREEQQQPLIGGYYGMAHIGAVTSGLFATTQAYNSLTLLADIQNDIDQGAQEIDLIIVCSSFGGTGASQGVNFAKYIKKKYTRKGENVHIHCIHVQPYFSYRINPDEEDQIPEGIKYKNFYLKSATVTKYYGNKNGNQAFIKDTSTQQEYLFDSFYYIGQEYLDCVSQECKAKGQNNKLHLIDFINGLAIADIIKNKNQLNQKPGIQLYIQQYSSEGTDTITWTNLPGGIKLGNQCTSFMRFSAFVLLVLSPMINFDSVKFEQESLIRHMLHSGLWKVEKMDDTKKEVFIQLLNKCTQYCRNYIKFWMQIEEVTKIGHAEPVTRLFDRNWIIWLDEPADYASKRSMLNLDEASRMDEKNLYNTGLTGLDVYDMLAKDSKLKGIGNSNKNGEQIARELLQRSYYYCSVVPRGGM